MLKSYKTTSKQGNAGLGVAIGWFAKNGYTVCVPLTDTQEYDLIVDIKSLKKVQVRTSSCKNSKYAYAVKLATYYRSTGEKTYREKKFDKNKIDFLFVLLQNGNKYLIPADKIEGEYTINVGNKYKEYKVN